MLSETKHWIELLATGVELSAGAIIGAAIIEALLRSVPLFVRPAHSHEARLEVRLGLGRWLALGLDFALAADILRTAVSPTWHDIAQLAAIAGLRTALNFFLEREIDSAEDRIGRSLVVRKTGH
jgi:uncharacterized membrane protein